MFASSSTSITYPRIKFISEELWLSFALEELQDIVNYTMVYSQPNLDNNAVEKDNRFYSLACISYVNVLKQSYRPPEFTSLPATSSRFFVTRPETKIGNFNTKKVHLDDK